MRICTKCKQEKPESEFYKHSQSPSGLHSECKPCFLQRSKAYHQNNKELIAEKRKLYYEANKARYLEYERHYRKCHPERLYARRAVENALKNGTLTKPTNCEKCNKPHRKLHGHHESYDKTEWLNVTWLCTKHHNQIHKKLY